MVMALASCACGAELLVPSQFPTIQLAVNAAAPGDTIILADGTYTGIGNTNIYFNKTITVRSENGPENCIIDCNGGAGPNQYRIGFRMGTGTLAGLTITRGYSIYSEDSAVSCNGGKAKITNCILTDNYSSHGGAIFCRYGNVEITNCSLNNNNSNIDAHGYGGQGGAIYCDMGSVSIANSTISSNSASAGGGIYCTNNDNVTIKNCVISDNKATDSSPVSGGGGIYCARSSLSIIGSQICRNTAVSGAGIYSVDAVSFLITDCNIKDNVAEFTKTPMPLLSGGGVFFKSTTPPLPYGTSAVILNSSITDNAVKGIDCKGGGLYIETPIGIGTIPQNINFMLSGCIIARNSAQEVPNQGFSSGGGLYCKGSVQITETEFLDNSAIRGGGIYNESPVINISTCRISGNSGREGSAIMSPVVSEAAIENSIISGNKNQGDYTFKLGQGSILKITNCTIVGNTPPLMRHTHAASSITNSIIYGNYYYPYQSCKDQISPGTVSISYSNVQCGYSGTGNIDMDPCFVQAGHWDTNGTPYPYDNFWVEGDYRLTAVSPCIDTGGVSFLMDNKDIDGNPRTTGAGLDMGAYEYQNNQPTADAGPDQVVYAWIDGIAPVILDGSASRDADGDELSYLWSWSIDGNNFDADEVDPAIELPVGQHRIELIVNDGLVDSQPDDVNVTVIGPVEARMWTVPRVINRQSWMPYVMTMMKLPEGITMEQIDANEKLLLYPGGIEAIKQRIAPVSIGGHKQIAITAYFDKASLLAGINDNGPVEINVAGQFTTGQYFFGEDKIWIMNPHQEPKLNLLVK